MNANTKALPWFVIINLTKGLWGRGRTLPDALKAAKVIKRDRVICHRIDGAELPENLLTVADLDPAQNGGLAYTDHKPGEPLAPWITEHAEMIFKGTRVSIDRNGKELA